MHSGAASEGTDVRVLGHPEAIVVAQAAEGEAIVAVGTFHGATTRLRLLRADSTEILADVPSHRSGEFPLGTRVGVSLVDRPVLPAGS